MGITRKISVLAALGLALVAGTIFAFHGGAVRHDGQVLAVVSYNVGTLNGTRPELKPVVAAIQKQGTPDLVLLQEVPDERFAVAIVQALGLPFQVFKGYQANGVGYGLAILSARPLSRPVLHDLKPHGHAALMAEMACAGNEVVICSLHLARVQGLKSGGKGFELAWKEALDLLMRELTAETSRSAAVRKVLDLVGDRMGQGVIVAGDFNTVPFSTAVRAIERRFEDALWLKTDYLRATYREVMFPVKPRIDYIFHSPDMRCVSASVMEGEAGDHNPMRAVLAREG